MVDVVLVGGPFTGPITQVGVDKLGGTDGTSHEITVFPVVDVPVASTVGVLQSKVWVSILAITCGAVVFCRTGTDICVLQKLELS